VGADFCHQASVSITFSTVFRLYVSVINVTAAGTKAAADRFAG
jgi:hypothetical protein